MKYVNATRKKLKKARTVVLSCGSCKNELLYYQKLGKGALLKLFPGRVIMSEMPIDTQALVCPFCQETLGHRVTLDSEHAYKMIRGTYQTKETHRKVT